MKIGILTFHAQINYGGMLQCIALQEVLRSLGHEVVVIDRWMGPCREELDGLFTRGLSFKVRVLGILKALLWKRGALRQIRHWRSRRFFKKHVQCTPYHFYEWKDAPSDLDLDLIVCGSDQIWHCGDFGDPRPYLLDGAPLVRPDGKSIRAIAYAASFGIPRFPEGMLPVFQQGLRRFAAISVREVAGVDLAKQAGVMATPVLDPTLLVDRDFWMTLIHPQIAALSRARGVTQIRRVVCYFISQDIEDAYPELEHLAREQHCRVDVISTQLRPHLGTHAKKINYFKSLLGRYPHVHQRLASGPREFLELFAQADACITDSFHALMFSANFNVNCRILSPQVAERKTQFSRFESFARNVVGPFILKDVAEAVRSIVEVRSTYNWQAIDEQRQMSRDWLVNAIGACN